MTFLEVRDLEVEFQVDKKPVTPIEGVSFELNEKEVLGIVGETGSGKSLTDLKSGSFFRFQKRRCSPYEVPKSHLFPRIR